jgi:Uma2 family endonuclease
MENLTLTLKPTIEMTNGQFFQLCQQNRDLQFERNSAEELIIMSPTGWETGKRNLCIEAQLWNWNHIAKLGIATNSSTGFKLPNNAERSPDASWVSLQRIEQIPMEQRRQFLPLCPDFVVELRSPTDNLKPLQEKMLEYIENGSKLGWLIDPSRKIVEIYRPNQNVEVLRSPASLSGEKVLPGFILDLSEVFN